MRELEFKFSVHGAFSVPIFADRTGVATSIERPPLDLRATYYDTSDLRLARNGVTLRYRAGEGPRPVWTLKIPVRAEKVIEREEVNFPATARTVPDEVRGLVTAFVRSAKLGPVATLRTRRRSWLLKNARGEDLAELVDDEVSVLDNRRVIARFREIEVERRKASEDQLDRIAGAIRHAGATDAEPIPKVVRALGARATAPPDLTEVSMLDPKQPSRRLIEASITNAALRMIRHDSIARLGTDPEGVHQMRVATRRLRSDLKTFKALVEPEWGRRLRVELKWLADALGPVRDLDVLQQELKTCAQDLEPELKHLFEVLAERHERARHNLITALSSKRYRDLLDVLVAAPAAENFTSASLKPCKTLPKRVKPMWQDVAREARSLRAADPDEKWHGMRKSCKRLRYAAEAIGPAIGSPGKGAIRFAKLLSKVQDKLGAHQDAVVACAVVQEIASERDDDASFNLAAGRLIERQNRLAEQCRARFPRAWEKVDRKKNLRWLKQATR